MSYTKPPMTPQEHLRFNDWLGRHAWNILRSQGMTDQELIGFLDPLTIMAEALWVEARDDGERHAKANTDLLKLVEDFGELFSRLGLHLPIQEREQWAARISVALEGRRIEAGFEKAEASESQKS